MNRRRALQRGLAWALLISGGLAGGPRASGEEEKAPPALSYENLLQGLRGMRGPELLDLVKLVGTDPELPRFGEEQLTSLLTELERIRKEDPFKDEFDTPRGIRKTVYPNRGAARPAILRLRLQTYTNQLRRLPVKDRVNKTIDYLEHPPMPIYETTADFTEELIASGRAGVPFMVQRKPKDPFLRSAIVQALGKIGDARGLDYIIEVLQTPGDEHLHERPEAARALASFKGEKAIGALLEALRDESSVMVEKKLPAPPGPDPKPFEGRYYLVRHAASKSLSTITGRSWGLLYNEDHRTWAEWRRAGGQESFQPASIKRTEQELTALFEELFHRYMAGRPPKPGPEILLGNIDGDRSLAADLKALGKKSVSLMVEQCAERSKQSPVWERELKRWTRTVLSYLDWPEARKVAETLR